MNPTIENEFDSKFAIETAQLIQDTLQRKANRQAYREAHAERAGASSGASVSETAAATGRPLWDEMTVDKLERRLTRAVGKAIGDFQLIGEGDRILVAISGGKDSWALLHVLNEMRQRAPVHYELVAVNIDQGYAGFRQDIVEDYVQGRGFEYYMEYMNIAGIIEEKTEPGATPCALCSRLRRGALYGLAEKHRCNKIALGHHADDFIETLLLNQFFVGRTAAMAPKLAADDGKNTVIRPLVYVSEAEIKAYVKKMKFPVVCCQCPIMCGETVHGDYKRRMVKRLIDQLELVAPAIRQSLLASLGNIHSSHMLDRSLWNFAQTAEPMAAPTAMAPLDAVSGIVLPSAEMATLPL